MIDDDYRTDCRRAMEDDPMFDHSPARPARKTFYAECIYAARWKIFMELKPSDFDSDHDAKNNCRMWRIQHPHQRICDQRMATVMASFACYLGTNFGRCFIEHAKRLKPHVNSMSYGFISAWAIENYRITGINSGYTILEHMLATEKRQRYGFHEPDLVRPILTADDFETVEHLLFWLGTVEGMKFIESTEAVIKEHEDEMHFNEMAKLK